MLCISVSELVSCAFSPIPLWPPLNFFIHLYIISPPVEIDHEARSTEDVEAQPSCSTILAMATSLPWLLLASGKSVLFVTSAWPHGFPYLGTRPAAWFMSHAHMRKFYAPSGLQPSYAPDITYYNLYAKATGFISTCRSANIPCQQKAHTRVFVASYPEMYKCHLGSPHANVLLNIVWSVY